MITSRDEGPIYYREIQKNAYLKRIPNEIGGSKLRPLGQKKLPLKPMWTLFCVHNGRIPFLEQYPGPDCTSTLSHKPTWRLCLQTARHVTASVKPHVGDEYDFLVSTDHGPVRMLAPDWDSMQDWVNTLRSKLHELKILSKGENVYCAPPAAPAAPPAGPRAGTRDPTSPLPPPPPVPPDRVPGIELTTPLPTRAQPPPPEEPTPPLAETTEIDISNWDEHISQPSTSTQSQPANIQNVTQEVTRSSGNTDVPQSVAKICGQNICLDDSVLKRNATDSDEEFFEEAESETEFKQRVVVNEGDGPRESGTNVTVIQVSNKEPPHTAIPVLGPETDVFNFDFQQKATIDNREDFINIVNTEINVNSMQNGYGTVFSKESDYGHLSLTTTVKLTGDKEGLYERLCQASTSNDVRRVKAMDRVRKSSLPNLDKEESAYEYLFPGNSKVSVNLNGQNSESSSRQNSENSSRQNLDSGPHSLDQSVVHNVDNTGRHQDDNAGRQTTDISARLTDNRHNIENSNRHLENLNRLNSNTLSRQNSENNTRTENRNNQDSSYRIDRQNTENRHNYENSILNSELNSDTVQVSVSGVSVNVDSNVRVIRSSVERSHSQNAYDGRAREPIRIQHTSPRRDKTEAHAKPIWKRGLTELSLLSRLRGLGQRRDRHDDDRSATVPVKVVRRSRPEGRVDGIRRRSSSLSNDQSPPAGPLGPPTQCVVGGGGGAGPWALRPLRQRQAAALRAEQRRGAAAAASAPPHQAPLFVDYERAVWVARWAGGGAWCGGRAGDRVAALRGSAPRDAAHARRLVAMCHTPVDILFHRVPLAKIYVINKKDNEPLGIKLDSEGCVASVEAGSAAARGGLPPSPPSGAAAATRWAPTEVNHRPLNLLKGTEEEMNRIASHGSEVSILLQPAPLVKKIRAALKANKSMLGLR